MVGTAIRSNLFILLHRFINYHLILHYSCMRQTTHIVCVIVADYGKCEHALRGVLSLVQIQVLLVTKVRVEACVQKDHQ